MMNQFFIQAGAIMGGLAVFIGAFGAHAFKAFLATSGRTDTFETAVKYQFYHALALVAVGLMSFFVPSKMLDGSGYAFLFGSTVFCGSLYLLCLTGVKAFGAIAPIGGLGMILGWVCLFMAARV